MKKNWPVLGFQPTTKGLQASDFALQTSLNEIFDGYDERITYLKQAGKQQQFIIR